MFNEDSVVVRVWVEAIQEGEKTLEEVPDLSNLRTVVKQVVEGGETSV